MLSAIADLANWAPQTAISKVHVAWAGTLSLAQRALLTTLHHRAREFDRAGIAGHTMQQVLAVCSGASQRVSFTLSIRLVFITPPTQPIPTTTRNKSTSQDPNPTHKAHGQGCNQNSSSFQGCWHPGLECFSTWAQEGFDARGPAYHTIPSHLTRRSFPWPWAWDFATPARSVW